MTKNKAYKTAIKRSKLSAPMRWLSENGLIEGRALDYGCGRGDDARRLDMESYDPHWKPIVPGGEFDTITCNYVLNVIPDAGEREAVLGRIRGLLAGGGVAYISVRRDKSYLHGWTKSGTWQGLVELGLPVVHKCSGFAIYKIEN